MNHAADIFLSGFNCSQAVFSSFADELELDRDTALKIATGFGAGMARHQEVCGAVTGGIMALGYRYGRSSSDDASATALTYQKVNELMIRFEEENGSCLCQTILGGIDLRTEEGQKAFADQNKKIICTKCVAEAERIVKSLIS